METMERVAGLRDRLEAGILKIPGTGVNGAGAFRATANTTNIWFDQVEGEALVIALDLKGVAVSGGSACHSGATEPSHVLMAMGLDKNAARASLRFSLLKTATEADVDHVCAWFRRPWNNCERYRRWSPERWDETSGAGSGTSWRSQRSSRS